VGFIQDGSDLSAQLKQNLWLLDRAFHSGLTAQHSEQNIDLQGENKATIKAAGIIEFLK
jgi:hypothetical protein